MLRAILILCTAFSLNKSDYLIIIHHFYVKPLFHDEIEKVHNEIEKVHEYVEKVHDQPENTVFSKWKNCLNIVIFFFNKTTPSWYIILV